MDSDFGGSLGRLKTMVRSLRGVLDDAEQRQIRSNPVVEGWLHDVQEAVLDAEGLLDEIEYEALRREVEGSSGAGTTEVRSKRPKLFGFFFRNSKEKDVERTLDRLEKIVKHKDVVGLKETFVEEKRWQRPHSTSLVEGSLICGRDADTETVIDFLLSEEGNERIGVIPIAGMGGVGKTTLAQIVFNDSRVKMHFDLKLWVSVTENYDLRYVTSALLRSASSSQPHDTDDLNSLQIKLRDSLAGNRFLIVLDDVWNEKVRDWEIMRMPLKDGAQGSKIIVTTRSHMVACITGTVPTHHLCLLTEEESWKLFANHAFGNGIKKNHDLEKIGRKIVRKCRGLPLAVKTLGGLLRFKSDIYCWQEILATEMWELAEHSDILPCLSLSFYYLPSHLKRCFAYCAIFPPDYQFDKDECISLWMAQNLLEQPQGKNIEDVGDQYFNDLVSLSLIQQSGGSNTHFYIHNIILDMATCIYGKYRYRQESAISDGVVTSEIMQHLVCGENQDNFWETDFRAAHVRSFVILCSRPLKISHKVLCSFLSKMKYLRTLSFGGHIYICGERIASICELRYLRYLKLSNTCIGSFPDSLCTLYNLQTLKFAGCGSICELPKKIHHLVKLRYLDASSTGLKSLPDSICRLPNLQKLIVHGCLKLIKLPGGLDQLTQLRYLDASCTKLESLPDSICKLSNLQKLIVNKCLELTKLPDELGQLFQLRYLDASSTGLESLPDSICKLSNLQELIIHSCWKLTNVPGNLHQIATLKYFDVSSTRIKHLPDGLQRMSNLRIFDAQSTLEKPL